MEILVELMEFSFLSYLKPEEKLEEKHWNIITSINKNQEFRNKSCKRDV